MSKVEFLGGPLDGLWIPVDPDADSFAVQTNSMSIHLYLRDEQHTGKSIRDVFRHMEVLAVAAGK